MSNCCLLSSIVWSFSLNISANFLFSSFWFSITFKSSSFLLCSNSWLFNDSCNWFCSDLFNDWRENTVRQNRSNNYFPNLKSTYLRSVFLKKKKLRIYWFHLTIMCLSTSMLILHVFYKIVWQKLCLSSPIDILGIKKIFLTFFNARIIHAQNF